MTRVIAEQSSRSSARRTKAASPIRSGVCVGGGQSAIKHQRRTGRVSTQTGRIEREAPLHISKVALIGTDGKPTRAGYEVAANGEKTRIDRRSGDPLPKPRE